MEPNATIVQKNKRAGSGPTADSYMYLNVFSSSRKGGGSMLQASGWVGGWDGGVAVGLVGGCGGGGGGGGGGGDGGVRVLRRGGGRGAKSKGGGGGLGEQQKRPAGGC